MSSLSKGDFENGTQGMGTRVKCHESDSISAKNDMAIKSGLEHFQGSFLQIEMWLYKEKEEEEESGKRQKPLRRFQSFSLYHCLDARKRQSGGTKLPWCLEHLLMPAQHPKELCLHRTILYFLINIECRYTQWALCVGRWIVRKQVSQVDERVVSSTFMQETGFCLPPRPTIHSAFSLADHNLCLSIKQRCVASCWL